MPIDVQMPDGTIISGVPDNITQTDLLERYQAFLPSDKESSGATPDKLGRYDVAKQSTPSSAGFSVADTGIALGQGIVGASKSLTDVFGADNIASQSLGNIQKSLGEQYSPARQAEMAQREQLQKQASKGTLTDEISTFLGGVAEAPVQSLAQGLGSIAPYIGTGIVGGIAKLGGATVKAINTVVGAAQGAGAIKGSLYDSVKQELEKSGMSTKEAADKASKAQEYLGENFLDIVGGSILGAAGARIGVENMLTPGAVAKLDKNIVSRVGKAAFAEAPLEGAQGGQEQLAINRALQKQGYDVGTFEGVAGAVARDAAVGALTGSAVGIRGPRASEVETASEVPPSPIEEKKIAEPFSLKDAGTEPSQDVAASLAEYRGEPPSVSTEPPVASPVSTPVAQAPTVKQVTPAPLPITSEPITLPNVISQEPAVGDSILQNRNRATPASIMQMNQIASAPDYDRVGYSKDFGSGAPVVSGKAFDELIKTQAPNYGKKDIATTADGRKIPVRYAVVNAKSITPSNNADGSVNQNFFDENNPNLKAIAGNARTAGLQAAYARGTANEYKNKLIQDDLHGVSSEVIKSMPEPMLVRIMPTSALTKDIGDVSNISSNLNLSTVEQAKNDANRIDLSGLKYDDNGNIDSRGLRGFINSMPATEQANLIDKNGIPTRQAVDRLNAAAFQKAYNSDELTALAYQATDQEARNVIRGLSEAASQMALLDDAGDFDIRKNVIEAAQAVINAKRSGLSLQDLAMQQDMTMDPETQQIIKMFVDNARSGKKIATALQNLANTARQESSSDKVDMFGEKPIKTKAQVIANGLNLADEDGLFEIKTSYTDKFIAEGEKLATNFRKALNKMGLSEVGLKFEDQMIRHINGQPTEISGEFLDKLITVSLSSSDPIRTLNHEALHAMKELGFFSKKEWSMLESKARSDWMKKYDIANPKKYGSQPIDIQIEEAIAHAFADYQTQSPVVKSIAKRIQAFLSKLRNVFIGKGFRTEEDIFKAAAENRLNGDRIPKSPSGPRAEIEGRPTKAAPKNIYGQVVEPTFDIAPKTKFQESLDNLRYALQDKHIDTKRLQEAILSAGREIDEDQDVYLKQEMYSARSASRTEDFVKKQMVPLLTSLRKAGISVESFEEYLHNRAAKDRNEMIAKRNEDMPDGGSGITTKDAEAYLKKADPKLEKFAKDVDKIIHNIQDILVEKGMEPKEKIAAWRKSNPHHVPMFREEADFENHRYGTGAGFSSRGTFSKAATGSSRAVVDILANIALQYEKAVLTSEKARVGRAVYGLALLNPKSNFWLAVNPDAIKNPKALAEELRSLGLSEEDARGLMAEPEEKYVDKFFQKRFDNPQEAKAYADEIGGFVEMDEGAERPYKVMKQEVRTRVNPKLRYADNVFPARIDGKDRFVVFNQKDPDAARMVAALKNLDIDQAGKALGLVAKGTRFFASINTQYNPVFGVYNFLRDVSGSMFNLSSTPLAGKQATVSSHIIPALTGIYRDIRKERKAGEPATGEYARLYEELRSVGGTVEFSQRFGKNDTQADIIEREMSKLNRGNARKVAGAVFDWLSDYNNSMENATRVAVYKTGLDSGLSKERAASIAKNITVNFNRHGANSQQINSLYAFFNASVQGTERLAQTISSPAGKKIIAGGILLGVAQAMALAAAGFEDDEPQDFIKERSLIIPTGGKNYVAIPMPLGLHLIPNIGRITTEFVLSGGKEPAKKLGQFMGIVASAFNPLGSSATVAQTIAPTITDPIIAIGENKDAFGRPIAKEDRGTKPSPGYTRSRDTASIVAKEMSYYLNLASGGTKYTKGLVSPTPDQLDYVMGQLTGGVGREVIKTEQAISSAVTGEELPTYKVPLVGKFYGNLESKAAITTRFYDNVTKLSEYEDEIKGRRKDKEDVTEFMKDHPEARLWSAANSKENQISAMNKNIKALKERDANPEVIKRLEENKVKLMDQFNQQVKALQK